MLKKVWIITRPYEVQAFYVREDRVEEFCKGKKIFKITDYED
jgi:hypothetical protein